MNGEFAGLFAGAMGQRIGWALLHFLWQGAVVAAVLAVVLQFLQRASARARYLAACVALGVMVMLPVVTAAMIVPVVETAPRVLAPSTLSAPHAVPVSLGTTRDDALAIPSAAPRADGASPAAAAATPARVSWRQLMQADVAAALPWAVAAWVIGVAGISLWQITGWLLVQRIRRLGTPLAQAGVAEIFERLRVRMAVNASVRLLESALVKTPVVIGWLKPVILVPASVLSGLSPAQLEAILAHELAHVRRWDCLVRMIQAAVETVLFFHPAVWWVSGRITQESENCCDEWALEVSGDRREYAKALAMIAGAWGSGAGLTAGATGGKLLPRLRRILGVSAKRSTGRTLLSATLALAVVVAVIVVPLIAGSGDGGISVPATQNAAVAQVSGTPAKAVTIAPQPESRGSRLYDAVVAGDAEAVKALAKASPDLLEVPGRTGDTPLVAAVRTGNNDIVGILLDAGAKVDNGVFPPLYMAVTRQYRQIAELLLEHEADVNTPGPNGMTALDMAIRDGKTDWATLLLDHGASVTAKDHDGMTAIDYARVADQPEIVELLESRGAKADIFVSVYRGEMEKVKAAIKEDPKLIDAVDGQGQTPLYAALQAKKPELVKFFLEAGAKVDVQDRYASTPLHAAAHAGMKENVELLLERGAKVNVQDRFGLTPLHNAAGHTLPGGSMKEIVELLLERGADLKLRDNIGRTPILVAQNSPEIVALLVKHGGDLNAQDKEGKTLLHYLVGGNDPKLIRAVLELGADANVKDREGKTPLDLADQMRRGQHSEVADLLRAHGAKESEAGSTRTLPATRASDNSPGAIQAFCIAGDVARPGMYKVSDAATVKQAIALAGGMKPDGNDRMVIRLIRRDAQDRESTVEVKVSDLLSGRQVALKMGANDVLLVVDASKFPRSRPDAKLAIVGVKHAEVAGEVYVLAKVGRPGAYLNYPAITVKQMLILAGITMEEARGSVVTLLRRQGSNSQAVQKISLAELFAGDVSDTFLQASDVLSVEPIAPVKPAADATQPTTAPAAATETPDQAAAAIEAAGGEVRRKDDKPDGPVVNVFFGKPTDALLEHLTAFPQLHGVYAFTANGNITDAGLEHLQGLATLRELDLRNTKITGAGLKYLRRLTQLDSLFLPNASITDDGMQYLQGLTKLRFLELSASKITDAGIAQLKTLDQLQTLDVSSNKVTDAALDILNAMKQLRVLGLNNTQVTDAGLQNIEGLTHLGYLGLGGTAVTDAGLEHLKGLTDLEQLSLQNSRVTDAGLQILQGLKNLRMVDLRGTRVTDQGQKKLQKSLPNCKITR